MNVSVNTQVFRAVLTRVYREQRCEQQAFCLTELIVVIGVVVLLLVVATGYASVGNIESSSAVCISNLREIHRGMSDYASENNGLLHNAPNHGRWDVSSSFVGWSDPDFMYIGAGDTFAYWGVAYREFVAQGHERFRCPDAGDLDDWFEYNQERYKFSTYGLNGFVSGLRISTALNPSTTIIAQDAAEQKMEGPTDSLGLWADWSVNLSQWRWNRGSELYKHYPNAVGEWFRHGADNSGLKSFEITSGECNTVWLDGHIEGVSYTDGTPSSWYTGK